MHEHSQAERLGLTEIHRCFRGLILICRCCEMKRTGETAYDTRLARRDQVEGSPGYLESDERTHMILLMGSQGQYTRHGDALVLGECPELFSEISRTTRLSLPNQYGNRLLPKLQPER
jgi:hypothetical protein